MAPTFEPKLSALQEPQRRLWPELADVPGTFVLCGGTAVALQLGHRRSIDFDFIAAEVFDPDTLYATTPFLRGSKAVQKSAGTLTCVVERGGPVQVSFFGVPTLRFVEAPRVATDNGLQVASLLDLAGMKAAVVQKRAEAKDYLDLDAIINQGKIDLPTALAAARAIYGPVFNPELTLKSLCYFGDGNLPTLRREVQDRLAVAVKAVDCDKLPSVGRRPR
jgi:Nucleotidyl transferase AbiEii toxin, Type IV TA system